MLADGIDHAHPEIAPRIFCHGAHMLLIWECQLRRLRVSSGQEQLQTLFGANVERSIGEHGEHVRIVRLEVAPDSSGVPSKPAVTASPPVKGKPDFVATERPMADFTS